MTYLNLNNLKVYELARQLSKVAWEIFTKLSLDGKRTAGYQFVTSTDSVGANIAEGYGRYHFLDRRKFYLNARASLLESRHWFELIVERESNIDKQLQDFYLNLYQNLRPGLNSFISSQNKKS